MPGEVTLDIGPEKEDEAKDCSDDSPLQCERGDVNASSRSMEKMMMGKKHIDHLYTAREEGHHHTNLVVQSNI